jgi:uncharacterized SAM-binding protein YcdF (DUF218 family)
MSASSSDRGHTAAAVAADLNALAAFLAHSSAAAVPPGCDAVVVCGSSVLATVDVAVAAIASGATTRAVFSGGVGHSTTLLHAAVEEASARGDAAASAAAAATRAEPGRSEAAVLADIAAARGLPRASLIIEAESTNCGSNASASRAALAAAGCTAPSRIAIVQDPTMSLRSLASFQKAFAGIAVEFVCVPPFVPRVDVVGAPSSDAPIGPLSALGLAVSPPRVWSEERFLSLLLGEVPRLVDAPGGYGPRGAAFIAHVDVPHSVLDAHERVRVAFPQLASARAPTA